MRLENFPITNNAACDADRIPTPLNPFVVTQLANVGDKIILDYVHRSTNINSTSCTFHVGGELIPMSPVPFDGDLAFDSGECCATLEIECIDSGKGRVNGSWKSTQEENHTQRFSGSSPAIEVSGLDFVAGFVVQPIGVGLEGDLVQTIQDATFIPANP